MRKSKKDRGNNQILLIPGPEEVENRRRRMPCFPPHDLNGLLSEAESQGLSGTERDDAVILRMRKINLEQIAQLGRALGVDPAAPDFWRRGFLALAGLHHGIGHISVRPKKTNRNSATWTTDHDLLLIREMCALRSQGLSDRKAIEQLSKDKKKLKLFPHRAKRDIHSNETKQPTAALRSRWQQIIARSSMKSLGKQLGYAEGESDLDRSLLAVAMAQSVAKIGTLP